MQILAKASAASGEENVLGRVEEPTDAEPTAVQKLAELAVARTDFFLLRVLFRGGPSPAEAPHIGDFFHRVFDDLLIDWFWEENGAICVLIADTPQMSILYSVRIIGDMIHQLYRELTDGGYRLYPILMSEKTNKQQCIAAYQGLLETEKSCLFCPDRVVLTVSQVRSANAEADEGFLEEQILRFRQHLIAGEAMPAIHHLDLLYHQGIAPTLDPNLLTHCRRQIQMAFDLYALLEKMPSDQRWTPHADGTLEEEYEQLRTWIASHLTSEAAQPGLHPKIRSALQYMLQHYSEDISQESMAQRLGLSPPYFSKLFKMDTGRGFVELLMDLRMEQARSLFDAGQSNVQQVASRVGFHDPKYFSRVFRKKCGKSPAQYLAERNFSEREEGAAE